MAGVLVLDDEKWIARGICKTLEKHFNFNPLIECSDGFEAIRILEGHNIDIVISDIKMPGLDGISFIEKASALHTGISFILISGHNDFTYARKAIRLGVCDYILKPIDEDDLIEAIKKVLSRAEDPEGNIFINRAKHYIDKNYMEDLTLDHVAEHVALSPMYLSHLFSKVEGKSYKRYLSEMRMYNAKKLLKNSSLKVYEISRKVGYNDYRHFCKRFSELCGVSPNQYRNGQKS